MLDTLFHIPHEIAGIPLFGFGWMLGIWAIAGIAIWRRYGRSGSSASEILGSAPLYLVFGAVILFVLPKVEEVGPDGRTLGLPIRGFGTSVMVGALSGIGLGLSRARRMGGDTEQLSSLAFVVCVAGFVGALAFYVIQYFEEFRRPTLVATVQQVLNFTEGGMVIYGSVLAGFAGGITFALRHRMPILPYCDLWAPSLALGMAVGRIGCFCHGCCFSGVCTTEQFAVRFPQGSPAYWHQFRNGQLHGIRLAAAADGTPIVSEVRAGTPAAASGIQPGVRIRSINGRAVKDLSEALLDPKQDLDPVLHLETGDPGSAVGHHEYTLNVGALPDRSLPVHPIQLYSFGSSFLLFLVLWWRYPLRQRDGEVMGMLMLMYPIARTLEEVIRDDEAGRFGTVLTISQWISLLILVASIPVWVIVLRGRRGVRFPLNDSFP
jgi:phosphatidylglycerol:prolipoprotein diacylglycerol transferase